jgi:large subunit ribosomal protein L29
MKASELRSKSTGDLQNEIIALLKEQFNLRIQRGVGQSTQPHVFKRIRKDIARIKTVLREKEGS